MNQKIKPIHEVRLGAVKAAIWEHGNENGSYYSVTLNRIYKEGASWKFTDSFGRDDLLLAGKVLDLAHTWIFEQGKKENSPVAE